MTFRLFSIKNKCYTSDPDFKAFKQESVSLWFLGLNGKVAENIYYPAEDKEELILYPAENFIVEAWTGYFDEAGRKIYCGDIIFMDSFFPFKSKILWKHGAFVMVPMDSEGLESAMGFSGILTGWNVIGNIHDVEFPPSV